MAGYIGQAPANKFLTLDKQTFTTSATDTYSLDKTVSSANEIELFLNNVRQEPIEAYTVSGNTLTLASAITSSDTMYCIYQGKAIGSISPATNSVSNDMLQGSIANSKLANSSVTVNGTSISLGASGTISAGITEADNWRITTDFTPSGAEVITANWERVDTYANGYMGTGMTESSGIFTFPSTGHYLVQFHAEASHTAVVTYISTFIEVTTDNSSFNSAADANTNFYANGSRHYVTTSCMKIVDVTDTSLVKVRFAVQSRINLKPVTGNFGIGFHIGAIRSDLGGGYGYLYCNPAGRPICQSYIISLAYWRVTAHIFNRCAVDMGLCR